MMEIVSLVMLILSSLIVLGIGSICVLFGMFVAWKGYHSIIQGRNDKIEHREAIIMHQSNQIDGLRSEIVKLRSRPKESPFGAPNCNCDNDD